MKYISQFTQTPFTEDNLTTFEVFPHNALLVGFTLPGALLPLVTAEKASAGINFTIYSSVPYAESDVIIYWGDGTFSALKNGNNATEGFYDESNRDDHYRYKVKHTYETLDQVYAVKIYGRTYFGLGYSGGGDGGGKNIISRIFEADQPVMSNVRIFSAFCSTTYVMTKLNIAAASLPYRNSLNLASLFESTRNLQVVNWLSYADMATSTFNYDNMFNNAGDLTTITNFTLPSTLNSASKVFFGCTKLVIDPLSIFPSKGFAQQAVNISGIFGGCSSLTIPSLSSIAAKAPYLWGNKNVVINAAGAFGTGWGSQDCTELIKALFPTSWAGTNSSIDAELVAIAICEQAAELPTGTTITFKNNTSIYKIVVSGLATYTLDTSELRLELSSYVFEVWVYMANAYSITFNEVTWLELPDLTLVDLSPTLFCLTFRTVPTKFGSVTISSPSIIGNLAYKHVVTVS